MLGESIKVPPENQLNVYVLRAGRSCLEKSNIQGFGVCSGALCVFTGGIVLSLWVCLFQLPNYMITDIVYDHSNGLCLWSLDPCVG